MNYSEPLLGRLDRLQQRALVVGIVGLAFCVLGLFLDSGQFFRSYLVGFIFWIGIALGAFAIYMLHNMVGGAWGFLIRRLLSAAMRSMPVMFALFVPILFGLDVLFPWARPEAASNHVIHAKSAYLNVPFFIIRAAIYFAFWIFWGYIVFRFVRRLEETGDVALIRRIQNFSAGGFLLLVITATFASVDWMMSIEPEWFSTIYGLQVVTGFGLAGICLATLLLTFLARYRPIADVIRPKIYHDLGNLMFAFNMLWAYLAFSQLLILYSGNLSEETPWYLHRLHGGWEYIAWSLIALHFATPFLILLSRRNKRNTKLLSGVAGFLLLMHLVDIHWLIMPTYYQAGLHVHWMDLAAVLGIGGVFFWMYIWQIKQRPLLLTNDPRMQAALAHVEEAEPLAMISEEDVAMEDRRNSHG